MLRCSMLLLFLVVWTTPTLGDDQPAKVPPKWVGTWSAAGSEGCKELRCEVRLVKAEKWEAIFTGVCNRRFSFEVKMQGQLKDGFIRFQGKTNLGEDNGGTYLWTGELRQAKFTGKYRSDGGKRGTFEMKPVAAKP